MTALPGDPSEDRRPLPPFGPAFSRPAPGAPAAGAGGSSLPPLPPLPPFARQPEPAAAEPTPPSASGVIEEYAPAAGEQGAPVAEPAEEHMPWEEAGAAPAAEAPAAAGEDEDGEALPWLVLDEADTEPAVGAETTAPGEAAQPADAADGDDLPEWLSWADDEEETAPVSPAAELAAPAVAEPEAPDAGVAPPEEAEGPSFEVMEPWAEPGDGAGVAASGGETRPAAVVEELTPPAPGEPEAPAVGVVPRVEAEEPRYEVVESGAEPARETTETLAREPAATEAPGSVSPESGAAEVTDEPAPGPVGAIGLEAAEATPDVEGLFAASQAAAVEDAYSAPAAEYAAEESVAEGPAAVEARHVGGVHADAFTEVADRLERIARSLRENPSEVLAGGEGRDPLELLVTGFVLGYAQGRSRGA